MRKRREKSTKSSTKIHLHNSLQDTTISVPALDRATSSIVGLWSRAQLNRSAYLYKLGAQIFFAQSIANIKNDF